MTPSEHGLNLSASTQRNGARAMFPAVRVSRLIGSRAAICRRISPLLLFVLFCFSPPPHLFCERGEETRGRNKWPCGADTVRESRACSTCTSRRHVPVAATALSSCERQPAPPAVRSFLCNTCLLMFDNACFLPCHGTLKKGTRMNQMWQQPIPLRMRE